MRYIISFLTLLGIQVVFAVNDKLLVSTTSGRVQGFQDTNTTDVKLNKWLGVRYGADTAGSNRWRPPQPVRAAPGELFNASAYGPACLQGR